MTTLDQLMYLLDALDARLPELLASRFAWDAYLLEVLVEYLQEVPRDDYGLALRLRIWEELVATEAEQFFESQLTKYNLEPAWAQDLTFAIRDSKLVLPIAQWRHCCWAATWFAAAQAQRHRSVDTPRLREDTSDPSGRPSGQRRLGRRLVRALQRPARKRREPALYPSAHRAWPGLLGVCALGRWPASSRG